MPASQGGAPVARIFAVFAAGYFLSYTFRSIGAVIAPDLAFELSLNPRDLGLLASVYFLAFGLAQPAIGIAMDRVSPARVNAVLIAIAGIGALLFAAGRDIATLTLGRALIGLGVAGALMTSFKAFVIWFDPRHRESLSGAMAAVGGVASMVAASPAEWLMRDIGWRGLFWLLAGAAALVAVALALAVPRIPAPTSAAVADPRAGGFRTILTSPIFLAYAPLAFFGSGGFSAIQSLWAGPWLIDVAGHSRAGAAHVLFVYGAALFTGYAVVALVGTRVAGRPRAARAWFTGSIAVAYAALALIVANLWPQSPWPWFAYGSTLGANMLAFPSLTRAFPAAISGRVVTAYNMLMFIGGFILQWAIGAGIQVLLDSGWARAAAFQGAFGALLACQVLSLAWFALRTRE